MRFWHATGTLPAQQVDLPSITADLLIQTPDADDSVQHHGSGPEGCPRLTQSAQAQVPRRRRAAKLRGAAGATQERGSPPARRAPQVTVDPLLLYMRSFHMVSAQPDFNVSMIF